MSLSWGGVASFVFFSVWPVPGIVASIPLAILKLDYPPLIVPLVATPLAFIQVLLVDVAWTQLQRLKPVRNVLEKKRSPRLDRILQSGGSFWPVFLGTPFLGPGLVMIFMRYANISLKKVGVPIFLSIFAVALVLTALCVFIPAWFT